MTCIKAEEQYKHVRLTMPDGSPAEGTRVLLHVCCAPCSAAIVECMLRCGMLPTVFFSNANIYPIEEYNKRFAELRRYLDKICVPYVESPYCHDAWRHHVVGREEDPERGQRCSLCFEWRLRESALYAQQQEIAWLTTSLSSSRWKNLEQINEAGRRAVENVEGVTFWEQNWRKGGLQLRRSQLIHENDFYNQQYCGCEFSLPHRSEEKLI